MGAAAALNLLLLVCWRLSAQNAAVSGAQKSKISSHQSPQEQPECSHKAHPARQKFTLKPGHRVAFKIFIPRLNSEGKMISLAISKAPGTALVTSELVTARAFSQHSSAHVLS